MKQLQKTRRYRQRLLASLIVSSGLLLVGCANESPVTSLVTPAAEPVVVAAPPPPPKPTRMSQCQSELASLQTINPRAYAARKASFDSLVKNASVYSAVRGEVNSSTKDTLDALYKYKTNQVCAEIGRDVLNGLIRRVEGVK
ncbi:MULTISPECIES: hypothetical protein [unclassified Serratia (in: enterobacteria)]|uniref:hypothetical protein n=1 Tax=unclassified Serratia (in: enterobacteria) TaxID=2647522 RepID=UPI000468E0D1|nr:MULTISPECIES: hypothetical protein [unclassified Serratia (in: enterobacteria)]